MAMGYVPIADYALIGDCHTAALVSKCGSVDWFCPGRFDASPVYLAHHVDASLPNKDGHAARDDETDPCPALKAASSDREGNAASGKDNEQERLLAIGGRQTE